LAVAITSIAGARLTASALNVDEKKDIERDRKFKKYSPPMSLLPYFTDLLTI
jgi:1,4-dihydroxy-2-naphthoate octaprenyltransferase